MLRSSGIMTKNVRHWLNPVGCGSPAGLGHEVASCTARPMQLCAGSRSSGGTWLQGGVWIQGQHIAYGSKGLTGGQTQPPGGDPEQDIPVLAPARYRFASPSPPMREGTEKATGRRRICSKQAEMLVMSHMASPDGASLASFLPSRHACLDPLSCPGLWLSAPTQKPGLSEWRQRELWAVITAASPGHCRAWKNWGISSRL